MSLSQSRSRSARAHARQAIREIPQSKSLIESQKTLKTHEKHIRNTTENNIKGEWTESENSKKDSEDNFKYEKLKR